MAEVKDCPDGHRCQNGSTCQEKALDPGSYECDCSSVHEIPHAGTYCDFAATEYCNRDNAVSFTSYCTNGSCRKQNDNPEDAHQGCQCLSGYSGQHCEFVGNEPMNSSQPRTTRSVSGGSSKSTNETAILASASSLVVVSLGIMALLVWRRRQRRQPLTVDKNVELGLALEADGGDMPEVDGDNEDGKPLDETACTLEDDENTRDENNVV